MKETTDPVAQLEADVTHRFEQGQELSATHTQERIDLEVRQRDQLLELSSRHATELTELEARQTREVAALWRSQKRKLGPGLRRQLGEMLGWKGATNGKKR